MLYNTCIQRLFVRVKIYVRVSLRESLAEWRSVLQNIMESSPTATQLLLTFLSCSESQMLEDHLLTAQVPTCFVYALPACTTAAYIMRTIEKTRLHWLPLHAYSTRPVTVCCMLVSPAWV